MFFQKIWSAAFQVLIYKGSGVSTSNYLPLIQSLQQMNPNITSLQIQPYSFFQQNVFSEETFLIGHSFGGYFALRDAQLKKNKNNIKGVVLVNSHFNSRGQAIYPQINQKSLSVPVLTLLGEEDNRLPLRWGLEDFWESLDKEIPNRFYRVYPNHGHFSGLETRKNLDTVKIACDIHRFIQKNYSLDNGWTRKEYGYKKWVLGVDYNKPVNILDFMYSLFLPAFFWSWIHFCMFLSSRAGRHTRPFFEYQKNILLKTKEEGESYFEKVVEEYKGLFYGEKKLCFQKKELPQDWTGLYQWLFCSPYCKKNTVEIMEWHLPGPNLTYYKFPTPDKVLRNNCLYRR